MANEKAGGYISQIKFNNGETLDISVDDIVVFVGPNNAGKSQSLKDIYLLSEKKVPSVVVSDLTICKSQHPISAELAELFTGVNKGDYTTYSVMGHAFSVQDGIAQCMKGKMVLENSEICLLLI